MIKIRLNLIPAWVQTLLKLILSGIFLISLYGIVTGLPVTFGSFVIKSKNFRLYFSLFLGLSIVLTILKAGEFKRGILNFTAALENFASKKYALPCLVILMSLLTAWQQVTEFLSLRINILPWSFYDYMLYYSLQGKINFTGLLHDYYHLNNILYLLTPLWMLFKSSWLLVLSYGPIACLAAVPLYYFAKDKFKDPFPALLTAFIYLNYHYFQKLMEANFVVEIFYPLFIFSALWMASREKWILYYLSVLGALLVKEDSPVYLCAIGMFVALTPASPERKKAAWIHGLGTVFLSLLYGVFLLKIFIPLTENNILKGNLENFTSTHGTKKPVYERILNAPHHLFLVFFGSAEKISVYFKLFGNLLLFPLLSPSVLLVLAPILPLYLHETGRDTDFIRLHFHYSAPVVPFVFLSFVMGFSKIYAKIKNRKLIFSAIVIILLFINGGRYRTMPILAQDLESIRWAKSVPQGTNLVTHAHLLPYIGYRKFNYYFANPFELTEHPAHLDFYKGDYYLIDFHVNAYPMDENYLKKKLAALQSSPEYVLLRTDDTRYLFQRKNRDSSQPNPPA